jgi:hypothetical protein
MTGQCGCWSPCAAPPPRAYSPAQRLLALFDVACRSDWERARATLRGHPPGYLSF